MPFYSITFTVAENLVTVNRNRHVTDGDYRRSGDLQLHARVHCRPLNTLTPLRIRELSLWYF